MFQDGRCWPTSCRCITVSGESLRRYEDPLLFYLGDFLRLLRRPPHRVWHRRRHPHTHRHICIFGLRATPSLCVELYNVFLCDICAQSGGYSYKRMKKGARGIEALPNIDFWKGLPRLMLVRPPPTAIFSSRLPVVLVPTRMVSDS